MSEQSSAIDLGDVDCLRSNTDRDQYLDATTPVNTDAIGVWFYLVREDPVTNYGMSSNAKPRSPASGDCP